MIPRQAGAPAPWTIAACVLGGALTCAGASLPWLSFFAGLQSYSGLVGFYGRALFVAGAVATASGVAMLVRGDRRPRRVIGALGALGVVETLFVLWLLVGLRQTMHGLGMHAMLIARAGPGLYVALAGALLTASTAAPRRRAGPHSGGRPPDPA